MKWKYANPKKKNYEQYLRFLRDEPKVIIISGWNFDRNQYTDAVFFADISEENGEFDNSAIARLDAIDKRRLWSSVQAMIRRFDNNMFQCEIEYLDEVFFSEFEGQIRDFFPFWQAAAEAVGSSVSPAFHRLHAVANSR